MTPENFVYWLQGFIELEKPKTMNKVQVQELKNHLALVLTKVTPDNAKVPHGFPKSLPEGVTFCASNTKGLKLETNVGLDSGNYLPPNNNLSCVTNNMHYGSC